ncbi:MAG: DUF4126 domain-containing protein [Verrucomicrobiota bacterium]
MDTLEMLIAAVGLGALAGINLYLTVFVLSLALRLQWIVLDPEFASLGIIDQPLILYISGALMVIEFFADKIPWLDSAWDVIHSFIRPLGAAFLGFAAVAELDPTLAVIAALLSGGVGLAGHAAKASSRLIMNASPEPVSNSVASLAEDGIVLGGLGLWAISPWLTLLLIAVVSLVVIYGVIRVFAFLGKKLKPDG